MENLEGFDYSVGLTRTMMNLTGVWPGIKETVTWYRRYQFLVPLFIMLFFINIPQTYMLFFAWDDFNLFIEVLTTADIVTALTCTKLLGIWYNKRDLNYLLIQMAEDWKSTAVKRQYAMWTNAKVSRLLISSFIILANITVVALGAQMLLLMHMSSSDSNFNETTQRRLFFISKFFFDTDRSPAFEICWAFQFLATVTTAISFISFDSFFIFSTLHLCGQVSNLGADVKCLLYRQQQSGQTFAKLLKAIVKRHIQLNRFADCIEDNFNKVLLIQMVGFSVTFCLQGYQFVTIITENKSKNIADIVFIIFYTITNTASLLLYCIIVERLKDESTRFSFCIYKIHWYELKSIESKMLICLMISTKHPPRITAGKFFEFSFEYFMTVMKTSLGYLSMLLAVKSRLQY